MRRLLLGFVGLLFLLGCGDDKCTCPRFSTTAGTVTLSSEVKEIGDGLFSTGFLFSQGTAITVPNADALTPDMTLQFATNDLGTYLSSILVSDGLRPMFCRLLSAPDAATARRAFEALRDVPEACEEFIVAVYPHQIWGVTTADGKHAKLLILQNSFVSDTTYVSDVRVIHQVARVTFEWVYQPNGSRYF